jgi:hypothetical protein
MRKAVQSVVNVLGNYLQLLLTSDEAWDDALGDDYSDDEIVRFRTEFRARPGRVGKGFGRDVKHFPLWAVVLYGNAPEFEALASTFGTTGDGRELIGQVTQQRVGIEVYMENNPDLCELHAMLAYKAMLGARSSFHEAGIEAALFGGMEDLQPNERLLPGHVWIRAQVWELTGMQSAAVVLPVEYVTVPPKIAIVGEVMDDDGHVGEVNPNRL